MTALAPLPIRRPEARILILDDSMANVILLERILRAGGYTEIRGLTSSAAFETELAAFAPDLILLDLHMPDPDGFAILARLAEPGSDTFLPVLVLTGDATKDARDRALAAGAHDFLTKPLDATEVLLRVRNLLETRFLYRRLEARADRLAEAGARSEAARAGIVEALNRVPSSHSLGELAAALCGDVVRSGFNVAAVLALPGGGLASVLAVEGGLVGDDLRTGPLPAERARYLAERSAGGPWHERPTDTITDTEHARRVASAGVRTALYVPLLDDAGQPVGLLIGGVERDLEELAGAAAGGVDELLARLAEHGALARALLAPELVARRREATLRAEIEAVIRDGAFRTVFQPVMDVETGEVLGAEALTRFADGVRPDIRFEEAAAAGIGLRLEIATLRAAAAASVGLPEGAWLSLNVSPDLVLAGDSLRAALVGVGRPVVLEITEHTPVADYGALREAIAQLGPDVRLAIDDAGAGFASLRHILELRPELVKLDIGLVRGIDADPARQALVAGMRYFATKTRCTLLAEGIETDAEAATLRSLAVRIGQGYLLGRPESVPWERATKDTATEGRSRPAGEVPLEAS